jgi:hypothetical protein
MWKEHRPSEKEEEIVLCLIKHCRQGIWGSRSVVPWIHNLGTRWCEWSASCPATLSVGKKNGSHQMGGWLGPRDGLVAIEEREIFTVPGTKPWYLRCAVCSLVIILTELSSFPFPKRGKHILKNSEVKSVLELVYSLSIKPSIMQHFYVNTLILHRYYLKQLKC